MATRSPKYDPQREEVYRWEKGFTNAATGDIGTRKFYYLLRAACDTYNVRRPKASGLSKKHLAAGYAAICDNENGTLRFSKHFCTGHALMHELAHWIMRQCGYHLQDHHNALWLGLFLRLLHESKVLPMNASQPSALAAGLNFIDPMLCGPVNLRALVLGSQL